MADIPGTSGTCVSAHRSALQAVCRLCGSKIQRRSIPKMYNAILVAKATSISMDNDDDDIHPPFICELCDRKLARWNKKCKDKRSGPKGAGDVNIPIMDFAGHDDNCPICPLFVEETGPDLLSSCRELGGATSFLIHNREHKVLLIAADEDGNSKLCLAVKDTGDWSLRAYGELIDMTKTHLKFEDKITIETLPQLIEGVRTSHICSGNPEYVLPDAALEKLPVYVQQQQPGHPTVRHKACPVILGMEGRCDPCKIYRSDLSVTYKRHNTTMSPAAKTNYKYIKSAKLAKKLKASKEEGRSLQKQMKRLKENVERQFADESLEVKENDNTAFRKIFEDEGDTVYNDFPENSPQKLLWEEQKRRLVTNPHGMRWHPAILRLCIAICAKSPAAYELIRTSGFLTLPTQRNLRHYTNFTDSSPGFNKEFLDRVCDDISLNSLEDYKKNVIIAFDEMKISQGLVYSHSSGDIIGFTNLGTLANELDAYSRKCASDQGDVRPEEQKMASHVLVLMIRGICHSYRCPIAYFATTGATSDQLYAVTMEAIETLGNYGLRVRGIVSDGAAANRSLYAILTSASQDNFRFENPYNGDIIYLFCDTPHLLKTARNNLENSGFNRNTRNMMFRGLSISWQHIINVYEWDLQSASSLRLLHRLTEEHVRLSPAHRMKVKLAAQVLSSSMANALRLQGKPETESTRIFIEYIDMFFDCLNVQHRHAGARKRKATLYPYTDVNDWRFTWLKEDLLSFLDEWESEGNVLPLPSAQREKLRLSKQTMNGIRITVHSFINLTQELLAEGVPFVLSEKFSQDPLEEYFAKQRGMGGGHDNPSVRQFGSNMLTLQVAGSCIRGSKRANVASSSGSSSINEAPLPRKKLFKK